MNLPKQLLENPDTSVLDVGTTAQNMPDSQKAALWAKYSTDGDKLIESAQIPNLIYDIFCQTVTVMYILSTFNKTKQNKTINNKNKTQPQNKKPQEKDSKAEIPEFDQFEEKLNQITQWMIENKLTKPKDDSSSSYHITKLQYKSQFPLWVLEAGRKKVKVDHPSAQLLLKGAVNNKSDKYETEETASAKSKKFYDQKYAKTHSPEQEAKRGKLHGPTRSIFFSEKVEVGYLVIKNCQLYDDEKLTKKSSINNGKLIAKGSVLGGPTMNKAQTKKTKNGKTTMTMNLTSVGITEPDPLLGYIGIENVNEIDIKDSKWKFEYSHVFDNDDDGAHRPSETTVFHTNDMSIINSPNNNDDEKMSVEEKTCDLGDPNDPQARV